MLNIPNDTWIQEERRKAYSSKLQF